MNEIKQEKRPVNKSAVVKIVIWSVVFCLLSGILLAGIAGGVENLNISACPVSISASAALPTRTSTSTAWVMPPSRLQ